MKKLEAAYANADIALGNTQPNDHTGWPVGVFDASVLELLKVVLKPSLNPALLQSDEVLRRKQRSAAGLLLEVLKEAAATLVLPRVCWDATSAFCDLWNTTTLRHLPATETDEPGSATDSSVSAGNAMKTLRDALVRTCLVPANVTSEAFRVCLPSLTEPAAWFGCPYAQGVVRLLQFILLRSKAVWQLVEADSMPDDNSPHVRPYRYNPTTGAMYYLNADAAQVRSVRLVRGLDDIPGNAPEPDDPPINQCNKLYAQVKGSSPVMLCACPLHDRALGLAANFPAFLFSHVCISASGCI